MGTVSADILSRKPWFEYGQPARLSLATSLDSRLRRGRALDGETTESSDGAGSEESHFFLISNPESMKDRIFVEESVMNRLGRISQLGLKEIWIGRNPGEHNRWLHSVGAFDVAHIWTRVLLEDGRLPSHWNMAQTEDQVTLALNALLVHDYGHLPFAHLTEEVLHNLNWIPPAPVSLPPGLEGQVLHFRFNELVDESRVFSASIGKSVGSTNEVALTVIESLIAGNYGLPWLQTVVNSPIDADKIDYVHFDDAFLGKADYRTQTRMPDGLGWLEEFLQDQFVNHAGMLCLGGRSARAAADLWRERVQLYDRFYLAPDLRVPDRIAGEILQQGIIRCTLSDRFRNAILEEHIPGLNEAFRQIDVIDPIGLKFQVVSGIMRQFASFIRTSDRELEILSELWKHLSVWPSLNPDYVALLERGFELLEAVQKGRPLRSVVETSLVREPLLLRREQYELAVETLRPVQHAYMSEVLIDIVALPTPLAPPRRWRTQWGGDRGGLDYQLLVPPGRASSWTTGMTSSVPLDDACVAELDEPYARVSVISPGEADTSQAKFVWDRVRAILLEANLHLLSPGED